MIRFRSLLSGAFLCAASTTSLWAQVPVVQPSALLPTEIPIISAKTANASQSLGPAASSGLSNQTAKGFLQGLNGSPNPSSPSLSLLPPIVKPGEGSAVKPEETPAASVAPDRNQDVPVVKAQQAKATPVKKPTTPALSGPASFAPHFKTDHPDLSLPTGVQIVKPDQMAKTAADKLAGQSSSDGKSSKPLPAIPVPAAQDGNQSAASPTVPSIAVPVVKSAALVKTESPSASPAEMPAPVAAEPAPTSPLNSGNPQDGVTIPKSGAAVPVNRPEIALPPIRQGEEFPRMQLDTAPPKNNRSASQSSVEASVPAPPRRFEAVPVGTGAEDASNGQAVDGIVQPAPLLLSPYTSNGVEQLPAGIAPNEIGPGYPVHQDHLHEHSHGPVGNNYLDESHTNHCESCGGAGCSHCGMGRWNGLGNRELLHMGGGCENGCFGLMPCAQNYFIGDVLYWTRNGGDVVGTDFGGVYDYDWNFGTQITMGTRTDPLYGHELVYFGLFELNAGHTDFSPTGAIDARFNPTGGLGYAQTYAFFDGEEVTQTASSRLHSFQLNRTRLGWDVVQSHLGLRYIWFEDEYQLQSRNVFGESGRLSLDARNQLIGPEVGVKLFYDVGRRISFSSHWKLGGYLNAYRTSTLLENDGVQELSNSDSGTGFSASFDLGANVHVHLTQRLRLRGGYGLFWLWDVASVSGNFPYTLTPSSGTSTNDSESAIFHGANVGLEFYW
jgi:hypothetical protein